MNERNSVHFIFSLFHQSRVREQAIRALQTPLRRVGFHGPLGEVPLPKNISSLAHFAFFAFFAANRKIRRSLLGRQAVAKAGSLLLAS
jgi:hypothetical protein